MLIEQLKNSSSYFVPVRNSMEMDVYIYNNIYIYVKIPFFHRRGEPSATAMNLSPYWVEYFASSPYTLTGKLPFAGWSRIQLATELQWRQYFLGHNDSMDICMGVCRQLG